MNIFKAIYRKSFWASGIRTIFHWKENLSAIPNPRPLSRDDILNCYRFILGRNPENEQVVEDALTHHSSFHQLRMSFLRSAEFQDAYKAVEEENIEEPYLSWSRSTVAFIHLLKTGGSTLHSLLERHFPRDRICPVRYNHLHRYSSGELSQYDLFSGHFDWFSTDLIARDHIRRVALFRDPEARLISFYRFIKSHPPSWEYENYIFVRLAHSLSVEAFFEHPAVRSTPEICNHYLLAFGFAYSQVKLEWPPALQDVSPNILDRAIQRVRALDGIGITERFSESVHQIFLSLNLPIPGSINNLQVTDALPVSDTRYSRVEAVTMTPRLREALKDLTIYDNLIYHEALSEFERRRKARAVLIP